MKIHKYEGTNEQELMKQIKSELGSNAVILNIKTIKAKSILRWFIKDRIEITVAVEREEEKQQANSNGVLTELETKMSHMEEMLSSTVEQMNRFYTLTSKETSVSPSQSKLTNLISEHLTKQEVEQEVITKLLSGTESISDDSDLHSLIRTVYTNIYKMIGAANTIEKKESDQQAPQIVFFIGPTGVGKTTSIAKLTAEFSLKQQKTVALITADTYRIAAIEQLKTYAEILGVPLSVIYSPDELLGCINDYQDKDYIFIDTAGRSHKNKEQLIELQEMLSKVQHKQIYLVLSATTKFKDLMTIVETYSTLCDEYSIIITKTDETTSLGTILNVKHYTHKPLSYISFGQNVPDDIEIIDNRKYAKVLLGSLGNE